MCTLGTDNGANIFTLGTADGFVVCLVETGVEWWAIDSRSCLSCNISVEGVVMPFSAVVQSVIAHTSLSAGVREGLVIDLCWKEMVSLSRSLLIVLM